MGRFINADAFSSTGQGLLGNNMFAYCGNNPVNWCDPNGNMIVPFPTIGDYYAIHKMVQCYVVDSEGYAMEVHVSGPLGRGRLDLYDAINNQYYEVKHEPQHFSGDTQFQMMKYNTSQIDGFMFKDYTIDSSPTPGTRNDIAGNFSYKYWDISYESHGDGIITYAWDINHERYKRHLESVASAFGGACAGALWGFLSAQHGGMSQPIIFQ